MEISLTKLLEDRSFKDALDECIVFPVKKANASLLVPATSNAGIDFGAVGVAYEYCLRCAIHRMSKAEHQVIKSFQAFKCYALRYQGVARVRKQMSLHLHSLERYLDCKLSDADQLFRACLFLAKFDAEYKSGKQIEDFSVHQKNVSELARIVAGSNLRWLTGKSVIPGPLFDGSGNDLVIRADGDLIVDKTLVDIKTSSRLALKDNFRQLVGYYALNKVTGGQFQIDNLGLYYPRFDYFVEHPISNLLFEEKIESLLSLFRKHLGSNIKSDGSRNYDFFNGSNQNEIMLTDEEGLTLLHRAAITGDQEAVVSLIEKGANPNARDNMGRGALLWAILKEHTKIAEILIKAGADVNLTDGENVFSPLLLAVFKRNQKLIRILIDAGSNVNGADNEGWTPLHEAVTNKQTEIIRLLISSGANAEIKDNEGFTALSIASKKQRKEMLDSLSSNFSG